MPKGKGYAKRPVAAGKKAEGMTMSGMPKKPMMSERQMKNKMDKMMKGK